MIEREQIKAFVRTIFVEVDNERFHFHFLLKIYLCFPFTHSSYPSNMYAPLPVQLLMCYH